MHWSFLPTLHLLLSLRPALEHVRAVLCFPFFFLLSLVCTCVKMPRYVVAQDEHSESESSSEDEQAQEQEDNVEENGAEGGDDEQETTEEAPAAAHDRKRIKLSLKQKQKDVCHVRCHLLPACMHGDDATATGVCPNMHG
jgi:hypothetical protein